MTHRLLCPGAALSSFLGSCALCHPRPALHVPGHSLIPRPARSSGRLWRTPTLLRPGDWGQGPRPGAAMPRAAGHCPFRALWADGAGRRRQLAHALSLTRRTHSYSQLRAAVSAGAERARAHVPTPRGCSSPSPPSRTAVFPGLLDSVALLPPPHFLGGLGENGRGEAHPAPLCCRRVSMEAFGSAWEGETCRRVASPRPSRGRRPFLPFYFEGAGL